MKNSNLFVRLSCIFTILLLSCMVKLTAQNDLNGYTFLGILYNHYYYLSDCETTWDAANDAAIEMGGYLAAVTSYEETIVVGPWAYNFSEAEGAWIGLREELGIYEWSNGEEVLFWNFDYWTPFYPDGAAVIGNGHNFRPAELWISQPVFNEFKYIVEFPFQPNCNNSNKTYVCHNGNTICINTSALQSHLDHGDLAGPCGPCNTNALQAVPDEIEESEGHSLEILNIALSESQEEHHLVNERQVSKQIHLYPNPASVQIHVVLPEVSQEGILGILSLTGQEIHAQPLRGQQSITFDLSSYATGIYLIEVRSANGHYQKKFVKL